MPLAPEVVAMFVCPQSKGRLLYFPRGESGSDPSAEFLLCPTSRLRYRIDDGVPALLIEEAERLSDKDVERLVGRAKALGIV